MDGVGKDGFGIFIQDMLVIKFNKIMTKIKIIFFVFFLTILSGILQAQDITLNMITKPSITVTVSKANMFSVVLSQFPGTRSRTDSILITAVFSNPYREVPLYGVGTLDKKYTSIFCVN